MPRLALLAIVAAGLAVAALAVAAEAPPPVEGRETAPPRTYRPGPAYAPQPAPGEVPPMPAERNPPMLPAAPVAPDAPMVTVRLLLAELVSEPKPEADAAAQPAAQPAAPFAVADFDLGAPIGEVQAGLGKLGLSGRLDSLYHVQLAGADGQKATVHVGQTQPTVTGASSTQFGQMRSVNYQNTGLKVTVRPRVDRGEVVTLDVEIAASCLGSEAEGLPIATSPQGEVVARAAPTRQFETQTIVRVPNGRTVVASGLVSRTGDRTRQMVLLVSAATAPVK